MYIHTLKLYNERKDVSLEKAENKGYFFLSTL